MFSASAIVRCWSDDTSPCRSPAPGTRAHPALEAAERDRQAGELLAQVVVQVARDPRPLDFLGRDQPSGQILNLLMAGLQDRLVLAHRLFGALPFGDVHLGPDQALQACHPRVASAIRARGTTARCHPCAASDARLRTHRSSPSMHACACAVDRRRGPRDGLCDPQSSGADCDLRVLEPQDRFERGVHVDLVGLEVPVPDADARRRRSPACSAADSRGARLSMRRRRARWTSSAAMSAVSSTTSRQAPMRYGRDCCQPSACRKRIGLPGLMTVPSSPATGARAAETPSQPETPSSAMNSQ